MLGGSEHAFVREISFVDPATQRTTITSVNLSLSQYVSVLESISYTPSPSSPHSKTKFDQSVAIQARMGSVWKSVGSQLEKWSAQRFGDNAAAGRLGFESVLVNMRRRIAELEMQRAEATS